MNQMPGSFPQWEEPHQPPGSARPAGPDRPAYPLDFERILNMTFSLYRFGFRRYFLVGLVLFLPVMLLVTLLQMLASGDLLRAQQAQLDFIEGRPIDTLALFPLSAILIGLITTFVVGAASFVVQGGLVDMTATIYGGQPASARKAIRATLGRSLTLAGAGLLVMLATLGVMLVGVIVGTLLIVANFSNGALQPGPLVFLGIVGIVATLAVLIFVSVRLAFAVPVIVIEGKPAVASLGRSWRLVSGSAMRVLGYSITFGLLVGVISLILTAVLELIVGSGIVIDGDRLAFDPVRYLISGLLAALITIALAPIGIIAMTLLFYDVRFRRESVTEKQVEPRVQG